VLAGVQFAVLTGIAAFSDGVYNADDLTHFLLARSAWASPANFLDGWGRPGCTTPLSLAASLGDVDTGWFLARVLNAAMAATCTVLAFQASRLLKIRGSIFAALLMAIQPLFFQLGITTLTEMPCALYLALALVAGLRERHLVSAAWLSLTFVTRHECVVLAGIWCVWWLRSRARGCMTSHRLVLAGALLAWAPLVVNLAGLVVSGQLPWRIFLEVKPTGSGFYGHGLPTSMGVNWLVAVGPVPALLACFGLFMLHRRLGGGLVTGAFLAYLAVHSLLFSLNLFASGGYFRFMAVVAVPTAILAARGLEWLRDPVRGRTVRVAWLFAGLWILATVCVDLEIGRFLRRYEEASPAWKVARLWIRALIVLPVAGLLLRRWIDLAARSRVFVWSVVVIAILVQAVPFGCFVRAPLKRRPMEARLVASAEWVRRTYPGRRVMATSDWVVYGLDLTRRVDMDFHWNEIQKAPAGTLYVCDVHPGDWRVGLGAETVEVCARSPGFRTLRLFGDLAEGVGIFEKR